MGIYTNFKKLDDDLKIKIEWLINSTSMMFEMFCNRPLKEQEYSYESTSPNFNPDYSIFDGMRGIHFFLPTYPVSEVTSLIISGSTISEAVEYNDTNGYFLHKKRGHIQYLGGFDFGSKRNVKINWKGGYAEGSAELEALKFLCYDMCKTIIHMPKNSFFLSERIGNSSYSVPSPSHWKELKGIAPNIFGPLSAYKKAVI